jgi:hypothetical protein
VKDPVAVLPQLNRQDLPNAIAQNGTVRGSGLWAKVVQALGLSMPRAVRLVRNG